MATKVQRIMTQPIVRPPRCDAARTPCGRDARGRARAMRCARARARTDARNGADDAMSTRIVDDARVAARDDARTD